MSQQRPKLNKEYMGITEGLPLQASAGGVDELRKNIQHLMDIEAIKQLKYAYFRCIDTANLEELAELFHEDVLVHFLGGTYEWKVNGRQDYVDNIRESFNNQSIGHHNGHHPEIQVLSETEATGIWYLADHMWMMGHQAHTTGTALYWDRYEKVDGKWLIRETRYERLYEINTLLEKNPSPASHYLGVHGQAPSKS
ncbi:nuclear transport factor 2 family protein [Parahaliea sp. F7430]|uniref:Nuclear transport factor 2 family protein n=1 Tax=Sediminihaliea albiluteola TaxID=2758564 RepID=A0A7W2YJU4_9GAMM|nr:nuclear transport factor 2 family protein [Sediminihaliea albiluteola]MBA6413452.1 nuclear transport factor 2 family protein [Sediminihaliea albiluteola]